jgi:predicted ribosomally synthesized peptide with SipW-like signal peptide
VRDLLIVSLIMAGGIALCLLGGAVWAYWADLKWRGGWR